MKRALAGLISIAMVASLWLELDYACTISESRGSSEPSILAADAPSAPAEPREHDAGKQPAVLGTMAVAIARRPEGTVVAPARGLGAGELHAPLVERPPIPSPFLV